MYVRVYDLKILSLTSTRRCDWWNNYLVEQRKCFRRARKHLNRLKKRKVTGFAFDEALIAFRVARSRYRASVEKAKGNLLRRVVQRLDSEGPWSPLYHEFKANRSVDLAFVQNIKVNNVHTTGIEETTEVLLDELIPDDISETDNDYHQQIRSWAAIPPDSPLLLKGNLKSWPSIKFQNVPVKRKESVCYLGLVLEKNFSFIEHIKTISEKAKNNFYALTRISKATWGLSFLTLKTIYGATYLGCVCYGAPVWADRATIGAVRRKLLQGQRLALIFLCKAYRTVSTEALPVLAGLLPVDLEVQRRAAMYYNARPNFSANFLAQHGNLLPRAVAFTSSFHPCMSDWRGHGWRWITVLPSFSLAMATLKANRSHLNSLIHHGANVRQRSCNMSNPPITYSSRLWQSKRNIMEVETIVFFSSPLIISSDLFRCGIQDSHSCPWDAPDFNVPVFSWLYLL
ncbi:hypothetical protein SFRURICE_005282 [Spodoptera frugiperda]|nr:hypothetical protein SFRURICE_005282 [Spodoptera frugiperda]